MYKVHTIGPRKGADFLVHVDPKQLKAQGVEFVGIYLKNTTKGVVKAYHDAGLSVFLIHQRGYEGKLPNAAAYGTKHGLEANQQALALGYPKGAPIMAASMGDYDNTAATLARSLDYYRAFVDACDHPVGAYGDWDLLAAIDALPIKYHGALNVQAAAKAWSFDWFKMRWKGVHPTAHMLQYPQKAVAVQRAPWSGVMVDWLDATRAVKLWAKPATEPVRVPPPVLRRRAINRVTVNRNVTWLQQQLKFWKFYSGALDGKFLASTEAAVKKMQTAIKLPATGVYDNLTAVKWQEFQTAMRDLAAGQ